jgi:hypothetical protein
MVTATQSRKIRPAFLHLLIRDERGELLQWFHRGCVISADCRLAETNFENLEIPISTFDLPDALPEEIPPDAQILVTATLVSTEEGRRQMLRLDERWPTTVEILGSADVARWLQLLGGSLPVVSVSR